MATVSPPTEQAADLLQNLSLDGQTKGLEHDEPNEKPSSNTKPSERSSIPFLQDPMDQTVCLLTNSGYSSAPYYYGVYDGSATNVDGVEMQPGVYGDSGSHMHPSYGYTPYSPYPNTGSIPTYNHDGQLYGPQHCQYPYFQPLNPTCGPYSPCPTPSLKVDISFPPAEKVDPHIEIASVNSNGVLNGDGLKGNKGSATVKSIHQGLPFNSNNFYGRGSLPGAPLSFAYQDSRLALDAQWSDSMLYSNWQPRPFTNSSSKNLNICPQSIPMGLQYPGLIPEMYQNKMYGQYGNAFISGLTSNGHGWFGVNNKYKPRVSPNGYYIYGNQNIDGLNELNRGPRAKNAKNLKGCTPVSVALKADNDLPNAAIDMENDKLNADLDQYNQSNFCVNYTNAKFFVIKSYSEDDVHKSIKYNVWASTPNGNKKLDAAYQESLEKSGGCPVFLLFSVNTSGQFVGLAEMVGRVDFNKTVEYWQQDKWNGCFPVKWHIVKDVPNSLLKYITLENNENKPVTNSRDTQEVKFEQGLQLIKVLKNYVAKTCILDDFAFYEGRQKIILDKKAKLQQFTRQVFEGKLKDEDKKETSPKSFLNETSQTIQTNGETRELFEKGSVQKTADGTNVSKPKISISEQNYSK